MGYTCSWNPAEAGTSLRARRCALPCLWSLQRVSLQQIKADKHWVGAYPQQTRSFEVLAALASRGDYNQKTKGKMWNQVALAAASFFSFVSVCTLESPAQIMSVRTLEHDTVKALLWLLLFSVYVSFIVFSHFLVFYMNISGWNLFSSDLKKYERAKHWQQLYSQHFIAIVSKVLLQSWHCLAIMIVLMHTGQTVPKSAPGLGCMASLTPYNLKWHARSTNQFFVAIKMVSIHSTPCKGLAIS